MRVRYLAAPLALFVSTAFVACSDDPEKKDDTTTAPTTTETDATTTTTPDVTEETSTPDAESCEHPCANAFGTNDKSLCPVPQSEWNCVELCCVPVFKCQDDDDCRTTGRELGQCGDDRFDCHCNTGTGACSTFFCGAQADCGDGEVCSAGNCVAAPSNTGLSIRILDRRTALTPGSTYQLHVEAYDPADANTVAAVTPTWESSDPTHVAVDANGLLTGGAVGGPATITATHGGKTATLAVENVLLSATAPFKAIVRTETTLEVPTGRWVVIGNDGTVIGGSLSEVNGNIEISESASISAPYDLHVLPDNADWVSWLDLPEGTTMYLPLTAATYGKIELDADNKVVDETTTLDGTGVVNGTPGYGAHDPGGTFEIVITTQGLSSALFDFSLSSLLGSDVKRYVDPDASLPGLDPTEPLTLPGGIVFNFAGEPTLPDFYLSFPKGHNRLWSLGGKLDLGDLGDSTSKIVDAVTGGDSIDFTQIVGAIFPLFKSFRSGYVADVEITQPGNKQAKLTVNPTLEMPMGIFTNVDVPKLPAIGALGWADGLFLLGGAQTVDGYMVALGLNGGADTSDKEKNPPDGFADAKESTPQKDPFLLPIAPLHDGLQGPHTRYIMAIVAAAIPAGGEDKRPSAGAATIVRSPLGEKPPASQSLPDFLAFPFLPASNNFNRDERTVSFDNVEGADIQRILFKGKRGKHWTFYGVHAGTPLVVPTMATLGLPDEADRANPDTLDTVLINSIDFAEGTDVSKLGRPGGIALDMLLEVVSRVSFIDIKNPIDAGVTR